MGPCRALPHHLRCCALVPWSRARSRACHHCSRLPPPLLPALPLGPLHLLLFRTRARMSFSRWRQPAVAVFATPSPPHAVSVPPRHTRRAHGAPLPELGPPRAGRCRSRGRVGPANPSGLPRSPLPDARDGAAEQAHVVELTAHDRLCDAYGSEMVGDATRRGAAVHASWEWREREGWPVAAAQQGR